MDFDDDRPIDDLLLRAEGCCTCEEEHRRLAAVREDWLAKGSLTEAQYAGLVALTDRVG